MVPDCNRIQFGVDRCPSFPTVFTSDWFPVEEVMTALSALPGIGGWTAQYVALRALNEPDAFPAADLVL